MPKTKKGKSPMPTVVVPVEKIASEPLSVQDSVLSLSTLKGDSFPLSVDTKSMQLLSNKASKTSYCRSPASGTDVACPATPHVVPSKFRQPSPLRGENPNDLLIRLYAMWPEQHSASFRPHATLNPEFTAEHNQKILRDWCPPKPDPREIKQNRAFRGAAKKVSVVQAVMNVGPRPDGGDRFSLSRGTPKQSRVGSFSRQSSRSRNDSLPSAML